jgi:hypothetical protein
MKIKILIIQKQTNQRKVVDIKTTKTLFSSQTKFIFINSNKLFNFLSNYVVDFIVALNYGISFYCSFKFFKIMSVDFMIRSDEKCKVETKVFIKLLLLNNV